MSKNQETRASSEKTATHDFSSAVSDLGSVTGHAASEVKDALHEAATHIGGAAKDAASAVAANLDPDAMKAALVKYTREHPLIVVGAAFAAGILVSRALR